MQILLQAKFSVRRHILDIHPNNESGDEANEESEAEIVYDHVDDIVPEAQQDTLIQQQSEKIQKLENDWNNLQGEVKNVRQILKSMNSRKHISENGNN